MNCKKKVNKLDRKKTMENNEQFTEEIILIAKQHRKSCFLSFAVREMPIKSTIKYT